MKPSILPWLVLGLVCLPDADAQSLWTQRSNRAGIRLEFLSPQFKTNSPGFSYSYSILTLSGRIPFGGVVAAIVEVPMVWETSRNPISEISANDIGNMFIGIEIGSPESWIFGEVGARPFLRQEMKTSMIGGYLGDFDRFEAYYREVTTYELALNVASTERKGFVYRIRVGPTIVTPESNEGTTFIDYGAKAGYDDGSLSLYGGFTGRASTESGSGKNVFHHLGFDLGYRLGSVRPAFFIRLPLDKEINETMPQTIGGSISVEI